MNKFNYLIFVLSLQINCWEFSECKQTLIFKKTEIVQALINKDFEKFKTLVESGESVIGHMYEPDAYSGRNYSLSYCEYALQNKLDNFAKFMISIEPELKKDQRCIKELFLCPQSDNLERFKYLFELFDKDFNIIDTMSIYKKGLLSFLKGRYNHIKELNTNSEKINRLKAVVDYLESEKAKVCEIINQPTGLPLSVCGEIADYL